MKYLKGEIKGVGRVVVFPNDFKQNDKHPDWFVYRTNPQGGTQKLEKLGPLWENEKE